MYIVEQQFTAQHTTAQRYHPCIKKHTKHVPIRGCIKRSTYVLYIHCVPFVFLEHEALGICKSPVCT